MVRIQEVLAIHEQVVKIHGGSAGIRDIGGLKSAIARPFQSFGGEDLYPTAFDKAAAIGESIIMNHPFVDGNKRTGYVLMEILLRVDSKKIIATDEGLYQFVISISTGEFHFEQITEWLKANTAAI